MAGKVARERTPLWKAWLAFYFCKVRQLLFVLLKRRILAPWLLSAAVMFILSAVWHGWALTDLDEIKIDKGLYWLLSGLAYLALGLGMTLLVHWGIMREWIKLKNGFPWMGMLIGCVVGAVVYLVVLLAGFSFADHGVQHVVADVLWQVFEQAMGGLMVALGIIYDLNRTFMETEKAH
jgi:hypothetical protein